MVLSLFVPVLGVGYMSYCMKINRAGGLIGVVVVVESADVAAGAEDAPAEDGLGGDGNEGVGTRVDVDDVGVLGDSSGDGGLADYKDIFNGFPLIWKILLIHILTNVFIALWSLLFVFPGIIAYYRYRQAYYILLDDPEKGVLQCIRESKTLMAGCKVDLFMLDISFLGWYVLDIMLAVLLPLPFALPIVAVWLMPYEGISRASFYDAVVQRLAA
jgi:hypothetical protein